MESSKNNKRKKHRKIRVRSKHGSLIIVGGREDKTDEMTILKEIVNSAEGGKIVVVTAASELADEVWEDYKDLFKKLGAKKIEHLKISQPEDAKNPELKEFLKGTRTVFFTGGDQLRITTKIGGTYIMDWLLEVLESGGTIAGTSAGAAMMGEIMLVGGEENESHKVGNWMMSPGLGFVHNLLVDQHFAQRGRIGRLLGAVALNPGILGIGIDENTAIVVKSDKFRVIGKNAVYLIDGKNVTHTNISERMADKTMSMHNVKLHILAENESFDLKSRKILSEPAGP